MENAGPHKTGLILYGLDRVPGGIGRYTAQLAQALIHADVSPTLLLAGRHMDPRWKGITLPGARLMPGLLTLGQVAIAVLACRYRLGIVHDPTGTAPLALTSALRVVTIHDVIPRILPKTSTLLEKIIYRLWLPLIASRLDAIITVSEQSRRDILRYFSVCPDKISVIPIAASPEYRPIGQEATAAVRQRHGLDMPYILYVGSLEPRKNLPRLLEAYASLRRWSSTWHLVIVGAHGWRSTAVFDKVQKLNLAHHVHFTGYVAEADLPALYSAAGCFAFPSLYEGFGLPVLEAMACGTPVVTSNISSLPEVTGDAAILIDPYDVDQIAHALWLVLSQPSLAARMREKGLARSQAFSWTRTAQETVAVYERVLAT